MHPILQDLEEANIESTMSCGKISHERSSEEQQGENTSKASKTTEPSHNSIQNKTDTVPRKVAPSKRENTGKITQTRFQKCFKDFCGNKDKSNVKKHMINCQNIE